MASPELGQSGQSGQRVKQAKLEALRRRRTGLRRAGSSNRLVRTVGLGSLTVLLAMVWMVREFELDIDELLGYLGVSVMFVLGFAACGVVGFGSIWLVKRVRAR
jgi:hypothetical protein